MKIRFWPHTMETAVASHRIRCRYVVDALRARGVDASVASSLEIGDVVVLSKRYDPGSVESARRACDAAGASLWVDICDNHFAWRDRSDFGARKAAELRAALLAADTVIASSEALAGSITDEIGARTTVHVIDDIVEPPYQPGSLERWRAAWPELRLRWLRRGLERKGSDRHRRLVWFGNRGGGLGDGGIQDLARIREAVEAVHVRHKVSLTVISNSRNAYRDTCRGWAVPTFYLPWHRTTISRALHFHGISVIPIELTPFTRAKTANRLTTSLVHRLAVVADPIDSYAPFADVASLDGWEDNLMRLTGDEGAWRDQVQAGTARIDVDAHNVEVVDRWLHLLGEACAHRRTPAPCPAGSAASTGKS